MLVSANERERLAVIETELKYIHEKLDDKTELKYIQEKLDDITDKHLTDIYSRLGKIELSCALHKVEKKTSSRQKYTLWGALIAALASIAITIIEHL